MNWLKGVVLIFVLVFNSSVGVAATEALNIELDGLHGKVELNTLKGQVVYLDFWASWCKPCVKSFPWMKTMKSRYEAQGFEVLAVNLDKERELGEDFARKMEVNFLIGFDPEGETASRYRLQGMPSSFLIGRDGKVYATHVGFRDEDKAKIEQAIKQLLRM